MIKYKLEKDLKKKVKEIKGERKTGVRNKEFKRLALKNNLKLKGKKRSREEQIKSKKDEIFK